MERGGSSILLYRMVCKGWLWVTEVEQKGCVSPPKHSLQGAVTQSGCPSPQGQPPPSASGQRGWLETTTAGRREERGCGAARCKLWPSLDHAELLFLLQEVAVASPGFNHSSEATTVPEQLSVLIWTAWHPPPTSQEGCEAKLINVCKTL